RNRPGIGLDGAPELLLVAEPALREAVEADLGILGLALLADRADHVVLDVAIDVELLEDRTVDGAPVLAPLLAGHARLEADDPGDLVRARRPLDHRVLFDVRAHVPQPVHVEHLKAVLEDPMPRRRAL